MLLLLIVRSTIPVFPGFISNVTTKLEALSYSFIENSPNLHNAREERPIEAIHANEGLSSPSE
jgi:hypothetical protein